MSEKNSKWAIEKAFPGLEIKKNFKSPFGDYQRKNVTKCKNAVAR